MCREAFWGSMEEKEMGPLNSLLEYENPLDKVECDKCGVVTPDIYLIKNKMSNYSFGIWCPKCKQFIGILKKNSKEEILEKAEVLEEIRNQDNRKTKCLNDFIEFDFENKSKKICQNCYHILDKVYCVKSEGIKHPYRFRCGYCGGPANVDFVPKIKNIKKFKAKRKGA